MPSIRALVASPRYYAGRAVKKLRGSISFGVSDLATKSFMALHLPMRFNLWGGAEETTLPHLEAILANRRSPDAARLTAACTLASWYDFHGDAERALSVLEQVAACSPSYANQHYRTMRMSQLLQRKGDITAAREILDKTIRTNARVETNMYLAGANLAESDMERLKIINDILKKEGISVLALKDPALPMTIENIMSEPPPCKLEDIGKVSVIFPAYQAEKTIGMALRSILNQTYANLEAIVVDDCSPDRTAEVVAEIAKTDSRVKLIHQPENRGAYPARNRGLKEATGAFITTHDADDWSHPQKLEFQLAKLTETENVSGVVSHWARIFPPFIFSTSWRVGHQIIHWSHPSFLFRRSVADQLGSWDEVRVSADTEFIWRVEKAYGDKAVKKIKPLAPLAFALDDEGSLTRQKLTHVRTTYHGLRHYYREISRYWHRRHPLGLPPEALAYKMCMVPAEMFSAPAPPIEIDLLLTGDLSSVNAIRRIRAKMAENPGLRFGLAHRINPKLRRADYDYAVVFNNEAFPLMAETGIRIVLPGAEPEGVPVFDGNKKG